MYKEKLDELMKVRKELQETAQGKLSLSQQLQQEVNQISYKIAELNGQINLLSELMKGDNADTK